MIRIYLLISLLFLVQVSFSQEGLPNDCNNAITICGSGVFSSNAEGIGDVQEIPPAYGQEHNSVWLKINIVQAGTLGFNLIPDDPDLEVDYDFWVFGPNVDCSNIGNPIRNNRSNPLASGHTNNHTGMDGSTNATTSGPGYGNAYVRWLDVQVGQSYFGVIDRPHGDGAFGLEWIGSATAGDGAFPPPPVVQDITANACTQTPNAPGLYQL